MSKRVSKYAITPEQIAKMPEQELKQYIRGGYKSISSKIRRLQKSEYADFSELLSKLDTLSNRWGGKFSGATKGLSKRELKRKAKDLLTLINVPETPKQLEEEGFRNIKDFFKEPRYTKKFIQELKKNEKILSKLVNMNDSFIHEVLPSDEINAIFNNDKSETEQYRDVLLAVSDHLDLRDNTEKEQLINTKWNPVFKAVGRGLWKDEQTGEVIDVNDKWKT